MENYNCKHCNADLDAGDILDHFIKVHNGDREKALQTASAYGVTETNRKHFKYEIIIQPRDGPQWVECKFCGGLDPLSKKGLTLEEARKLREEALKKDKESRKEKVDEIMKKTKSIEEVEKELREKISNNPHERKFVIQVLYVVLNDWDSPDHGLIRKEITEAIIDKYNESFDGATFENGSFGNQEFGMYLVMKL